MGFRLVPTSMTLNDLERRNSLILRYFMNSIALQTDYVIVIEDRPTQTAKFLVQNGRSYKFSEMVRFFGQPCSLYK